MNKPETENREPQWLLWAKRLQAIGQIGLTFSQDHYDHERYEEIRKISAEMMAAGSGAEITSLLDNFSAETGYATPKIDTRGVVFCDDAILLVRETADGGWTLPGGWGDVNETPRESVEREVFEESGFKTKATKLLALLDRTKQGHTPHLPFHVYKLFFLCEMNGGTAKTSFETNGVDFFKEDAIPELSISRTTPAQIHRMFEHYRNPDLPTDFD